MPANPSLPANWNPAWPVYEQSARTPRLLALWAEGRALSYEELTLHAARLAGALSAQGIGRGGRVGILASRSLLAVEALLAVAWCGAAWVPLGLTWPAERLGRVLELLQLDAIIADTRPLRTLYSQVAAAPPLIVVPERRAVSGLAASDAAVLAIDSLTDATSMARPAPMLRDEPAYIVFTSGTTGVPKGVMATAGSLAAYLNALGLRKALTRADRASQFTELAFDPSFGEILLPWYSGASLHVVPPVTQTSPARFIREQELTVWGSAPAAIAWMRNTRSLRPGAFPDLRYSSFGGEPLPLTAVRAWQAAAPQSVIDNLYGPTEATVDCAGQRVEPGGNPVVTPERGVLAIGVPHPGTELMVCGPDRRRCRDGEPGELAISGDQLTAGYLGAPELTAERFPVIAGRRWYLSGDIAVRDATGCFHHLGRIDNQVKINGHRVELEDIEANVREIAGTEQVAAVAWPVEDGVARSIVCFVAGSTLAANQIRERVRGRLPEYMVPATFHTLEALPLGTSGKLDRQRLIERLNNGWGEGGANAAA